MTAYDSGTTQIGQTAFAYDTHGRQNVITDARTGSVTNYFNNADQVSGTRLPSADGIQSPQITSNLFDNMGRIQTQILADSTAVTNEYYLTGQLKRTYGSRTYPVGYGYDAQGRMTNMTNWATFATGAGARVTTWLYNENRGWLDRKHYDGTNAGPTYSYTAAGRLQNRLWARGTNTTYSYNDAGDLATVIYDDGLTLGITNGYDRRGRLTNIINGPSTCSLAYDDAGNLLTESYSGGVLDLVSIQNIYDDFLRRKTNFAKYNGTPLTTVTNDYDTASRLHLISDGTNSGTYSYLANSPLVSQILFQQNGSNRMTVTKTYDYLNRLTGIIHRNPSSVVLDQHLYGYNVASQRTAVTNTDASVWNYAYDALGQVNSGRKSWSDGQSVAGQQFGYTFDDIGNRTQTQAGGNEIGVGLRSANYSANAVNQYTSRTVPGAVDIIGSADSGAIVKVNDTPSSRHGDYFRAEVGVENGTGAAYESITAKAVVGGATNLLSTVSGSVFVPQNPESFSYDADGNLTQDGRWQYKWDAENRLIAMTNNSSVPNGAKMTLNFGYDYQGRRISKLVSNYVSGTFQVARKLSFVYDGWNLQAELNGTNNAVIQSYMWGTDLSGTMQDAAGVGGLLAISMTGSAQFTCFDGNGNITALVDTSSSAVTAQFEYGPFGETIRLSGSTTSANPFQFSTKYQDEESGLLYYGYRYYNANAGRWVSRDPIAELGGLNLYLFVSNRAVSEQDYAGLTSIARILSAYFFGDPKSWIMLADDEYTQRVRKWAAVTSAVNQAKADLVAHCVSWEADRRSSPTWSPYTSIGADPASYHVFVKSPAGTEPTTAGRSLEIFVLTLGTYQTDELYTSAIGSFDIYVTVDDIDCCSQTATLKIYMFNAMTRTSFGRFGNKFPFSRTKQSRQDMSWVWTEEYAWGNSNASPTGGKASPHHRWD